MKQLSAQVVELLAVSRGEMLPAELARLVIPMLVNGTKEKNTVVRTCAESALVAVLRLKDGEATQEVRRSVASVCVCGRLGELVDRGIWLSYERDI